MRNFNFSGLLFSLLFLLITIKGTSQQMDSNQDFINFIIKNEIKKINFTKGDSLNVILEHYPIIINSEKNQIEIKDTLIDGVKINYTSIKKLNKKNRNEYSVIQIFPLIIYHNNIHIKVENIIVHKKKINIIEFDYYIFEFNCEKKSYEFVKILNGNLQ